MLSKTRGLKWLNPTGMTPCAISVVPVASLHSVPEKQSCWSCNMRLACPVAFCPDCSVIQPANAETPFQVFDLYVVLVEGKLSSGSDEKTLQ